MSPGAARFNTIAETGTFDGRDRFRRNGSYGHRVCAGRISYCGPRDRTEFPKGTMDSAPAERICANHIALLPSKGVDIQPLSGPSGKLAVNGFTRDAQAPRGLGPVAARKIKNVQHVALCDQFEILDCP